MDHWRGQRHRAGWRDGAGPAGAHVVISGRNAATNASALAALQAMGSAEALLLDVADKHAVKAPCNRFWTDMGASTFW
jgi:hypothetical protein